MQVDFSKAPATISAAREKDLHGDRIPKNYPCQPSRAKVKL